MDELYTTYAVLAGIAASFSGFGTIAVSLGHSAGGDDAKVDAHRLTNMLAASLTLTVIALVPGLLAALGVAPRWQVALPSIAALTVIAVATPRLARRTYAIRNAAGYNRPASAANILSVIVAALAFLACAIGWPRHDPPAVFLLGLMGLLVSSVIMFSRVALSLLLPHNED